MFVAEVPSAKKPAWLKQTKKAGGKKGNKKPSKQHKPNNFKQRTEGTPPPPTKVKPKEDKPIDIDSDDSDTSEQIDKNSSDDEVKSSSVEDDDQEWEKFQQKIQKREKLEGKSKVSHDVHCPLFPYDKQEYWWTYICDRKSRTLLTAPYYCTNLIDREEIQLKVRSFLRLFILSSLFLVD